MGVGRKQLEAGKGGAGTCTRDPKGETKREGGEGVKGPVLNTLVLGSLQDMRNSHLHRLWATTDRSEAHPLTNLEQHIQHRYWVTRNFTEGDGGNMPVRNEGKWGREGGDDQGTTCIRTTALDDPETSDASSKPGMGSLRKQSVTKIPILHLISGECLQPNWG